MAELGTPQGVLENPLVIFTKASEVQTGSSQAHEFGLWLGEQWSLVNERIERLQFIQTVLHRGGVLRSTVIASVRQVNISDKFFVREIESQGVVELHHSEAIIKFSPEIGRNRLTKVEASDFTNPKQGWRRLVVTMGEHDLKIDIRSRYYMS